MSTRSITHIHEEKEFNNGEEKTICSFYRHCDGYPTGHGQDLANWLKDKKVMNGRVAGAFNGTGEAAIKLMNHILDLAGCLVSVVSTQTTDIWEAYIYDIYYRNNEFVIITSVADSDTQKHIAPAKEYKGKEVNDTLNKIKEFVKE